jgi:nucleoside-diphosphate-sugar epimerase
MLIPRILRNDVPYINTNHSRDFIHINDLVRAIDTLIKSDFKGITDIGSGVTNNLVELVDYFGIDCERAVGEENERLDNLADNTILNKIGWSPNIKLYDYIKEKRNASN